MGAAKQSRQEADGEIIGYGRNLNAGVQRGKQGVGGRRNNRAIRSGCRQGELLEVDGPLLLFCCCNCHSGRPSKRGREMEGGRKNKGGRRERGASIVITDDVTRTWQFGSISLDRDSLAYKMLK